MKLSIITINYNNQLGLQKTIDSVVKQSFDDFEWIIIDGGSSDGSMQLIKSIQEKVSYWCSEKDKGIYNAINKGILHATGEYILFLNSGDYLYSDETLFKVFNKKYQSDVLYGDMVQVNPIGQKSITYPDNLYLFFFLYDSLCHQACFFKRKLFDNNLYDESFQIVSDWAMNIKLILEGKCYEHIPTPIVYYDNSGISASDNSLMITERNLAFKKYVPLHIREDVRRYNDNYYFTRKRKSLRIIMELSISICKHLDMLLKKIEKRK